jgi:hypothetical protein
MFKCTLLILSICLAQSQATDNTLGNAAPEYQIGKDMVYSGTTFGTAIAGSDSELIIGTRYRGAEAMKVSFYEIKKC